MFNLLSPGLELNDLGFLNSSDVLDSWSGVEFRNNEPTRFTRLIRIEADYRLKWDFGFEKSYMRTHVGTHVDLKNCSGFYTFIRRIDPMLDSRILRGGLAMKLAPYWIHLPDIYSDRTKKIQFYFT